MRRSSPMIAGIFSPGTTTMEKEGSGRRPYAVEMDAVGKSRAVVHVTGSAPAAMAIWILH